MNKTNQISAKTQYITPWCRSIEMQAKECILAGSYGEEGYAGGRGRLFDNSEEEDY